MGWIPWNRGSGLGSKQVAALQASLSALNASLDMKDDRIRQRDERIAELGVLLVEAQEALAAARKKNTDDSFKWWEKLADEQMSNARLRAEIEDHESVQEGLLGEIQDIRDEMHKSLRQCDAEIASLKEALTEKNQQLVAAWEKAAALGERLEETSMELLKHQMMGKVEWVSQRLGEYPTTTLASSATCGSSFPTATSKA